MTLDDWLARLERLHPVGIELGLERVAQVAARLLPAQLPLRVITVGGTNGKGSTCAFLEAMLLAAGYRVGLYTSPHLMRYNERVRIQGDCATDEALVSAFEVVEQARQTVSLTYFEAGTLAAMWLFCRADLDVVVLEVGLGGRLDAVNLFDTDCAVITSIGIDHVEYLGHTREAIAGEKAGIFRAGRPAVCADRMPPDSLLVQAGKTRFWQIGREFDYQLVTAGAAGRPSGWHYRDRFGEQELPMPALAGDWQTSNAAAAIAALRALQEVLPVDWDAIRQGLLQARVRGRYECLGMSPEKRVDVAHNPHGAEALARTLEQNPVSGRTLAVCGMLADKDAAGVVGALAQTVDVWLVAGLPGPRGGDAATLAMLARQMTGKPVHEYASVVEAWRSACETASGNDRIVAFGSFLTVAAILQQSEGRFEHGTANGQ